MRYGFVIDQNRCIGCHACTVACKDEHEVPLGVNRTWVKYIEKGAFPANSRHFAVLRCNHCDDAPCIEICPTVALFRSPNGIVDFDNDRCIGCKSCMQACPYDALYIDPDNNTAAKCNFCAHRVELGLQPACEVVCPTQAILSGDLDDPDSRIARTVATSKVSIRKAHKGTRPKLFYVGVEEDALQPTMTETGDTHLWAEKYPGEDLYALSSDKNKTAVPGGAREVYDVPHPRPWGSKLAAYLWTKSIGSGVLLVAALLMILGLLEDAPVLNVVSPILALVFTGLTTALLVFDLKRPDRFYYLLTKPNLRSWLVLGGYILMAYSIASVLWLAYGSGGGGIPVWTVVACVVFGIGSAGYSAFLFAQAKGRDLWQSPLFFWHLLAQAVSAGAASLILVGLVAGLNDQVMVAMATVLLVSLVTTGALVLGEVSLTPVSEDVRRATELLTCGALREKFWGLFIAIGIALPVIFLVWAGAQEQVSWLLYPLSALLALVGLWVFENLWVEAGQAVPLS